MNDVLPKPFTKEGLLNMLEKHLSQLKKPAPGMEPMPPPGIVKVSLKSEESPATSPATATNWNSPGGIPGVSPVASTHAEEYGHGMPPGPPYGMQAAMTPGPSPQALTFSGSPTGPPHMRQQIQQLQAQQVHKRQISEISGGPEMVGEVRRPPIFAPGPSGPGPVPPHMVAPPPQPGMPQFQGPMGTLPRGR